MRDFKTLLVLPASLLSLFSHSFVYAQNLPPSDLLPLDAEYSAEHEHLVKREWEAAERLAWEVPIGVRKMSGDPDEKFFLHYWKFDEDAVRSQWEAQSGNTSIPFRLLPGIVPHSRQYNPSIELFGRSLFARDFQCPGNTHSCSNSIGADICCHPDQTCVSTDDGPGCCPNGETCGDSVSDCTGGDTLCKNGCCIAGAECEANGCVIYGKGTTVTTLRTVTTTSGDSSTTVTGSGATVTVFRPTRITTTVTETKNGQTTTKTTTKGSTQNTSKTTKVSPDRPILPTSISASSSSNSNCLSG